MKHRGKLWSLLFIQVSVISQCEKDIELSYSSCEREKIYSALNVRRWQMSLSVWCHVFTSTTSQQLAVVLVGTLYGRRCEILRKYSVLHCCDYIRKFVLDLKFTVHYVHHCVWWENGTMYKDTLHFLCLCWSVLYHAEYSSWWPAFWRFFCTIIIRAKCDTGDWQL